MQWRFTSIVLLSPQHVVSEAQVLFETTKFGVGAAQATHFEPDLTLKAALQFVSEMQVLFETTNKLSVPLHETH